MDHQQAERLYQTAEDSHRAALEAWGRAFDTARGSGSPPDWDLEEVTWRSSRQAGMVRTLAWEVAEEVLAESRERVRRSFVEHFPASSTVNGGTHPLPSRQALAQEEEEPRPA